MQKQGVDTLILGCTHYPLLRPIIQNVMGSKVTLIDSGAETVSEVSTILDYFAIAEDSKSKLVSERHFYTTGSAQMFKEIGSEWLNLPDMQVEQIKLGND
jgi:glutamate racemase